MRLPSERLLLAAAHVHGHHRLERLRPRGQQLAQGAGGQGEADVVDGRIRRALDLAHGVELHRVAHQRPPRADASVQRRGGRRPQEFLSRGQRCPPQRSRESRRSRTRLPRHACGAARRAQGLPGSQRDGPRRQPRRSRRGRRLPRHRQLRNRVRLHVEQQLGDLHGRPPVHQRVVELGHDPAAAVREARRQPDLPQRPGAIERRGQHAVAEQLEALIVQLEPERPERQHVVGHVEVRVLHPERLPHPRRRPRQPAAEARDVAPGARRCGGAGAAASAAARPPARGTSRSTRRACARSGSPPAGRSRRSLRGARPFPQDPERAALVHWTPVGNPRPADRHPVERP